MAKWDLSKLPEGRKPLPDEWFAERAQMQDRIKELKKQLRWVLYERDATFKSMLNRAETAADRIEELEERLKAATDDAKEAEAYAGELEAVLESIKAKLAKALDFIQDLTGCEWPYDEDAKRILAELTSSEVKGGKDE